MGMWKAIPLTLPIHMDSQPRALQLGGLLVPLAEVRSVQLLGE